MKVGVAIFGCLRCDVCGEGVAMDATLHGCRICDWDMCEPCQKEWSPLRSDPYDDEMDDRLRREKEKVWARDLDVADDLRDAASKHRKISDFFN